MNKGRILLIFNVERSTENSSRWDHDNIFVENCETDTELTLCDNSQNSQSSICLSPVTIKPVFGGLLPDKAQTGLFSYSD